MFLSYLAIEKKENIRQEYLFDTWKYLNDSFFGLCIENMQCLFIGKFKTQVMEGTLTQDTESTQNITPLSLSLCRHAYNGVVQTVLYHLTLPVF